MISYPISDAQLHQAIENTLPATLNKNGTLRKRGRLSWLQRATVEKRNYTGLRVGVLCLIAAICLDRFANLT
jgi:hypothetical protein